MICKKFLQTPVLAIALVALFSTSAQAFSDDEARRAILDVRQNVEKLTKDLKVSQSAQVQLLSEINALKEQNRYLTGRIEELTNQLARQQRSARDLYDALDKRIQKFEPVSVMIDGSLKMVNPKEQSDYEAAVALMQAGKDEKASKKLARFVEVWDESAYRESALYWLGSTLFAQEDYKAAIASQDTLIRDYPNSARIPDSMLLVAACQASSGNTKAATQTLKKIVKAFPDTEFANTANKRLKELEKTQPTQPKKK